MNPDLPNVRGLNDPIGTVTRPSGVVSAGSAPRVAVVVPCYRVRAKILGVLREIGPIASRIYVVDDQCPEKTGEYVQSHCTDPRVVVIRNAVNSGVGGAVMAGYAEALRERYDIVVKVDGDGQMDPRLILAFVRPILLGRADYTKGNRFFDLNMIRRMPGIRIFGNAVLSLLSKLSTGYWNVFDPTNGYTAIDARVLRRLPLGKISQRYFFETDMLFRLNTLRAVVCDVPMDAIYADERSSLRIHQVVLEFILKHARNALSRVFYNYFLRDMTVATFQLVAGLALFVMGAAFGAVTWLDSARQGVPTPLGTIMLAVLPMLLGSQLLLAFLAYDIASVPSQSIGSLLGDGGASEQSGGSYRQNPIAVEGPADLRP